MTKLKVAVLMGGDSSERVVSLNSGSEVVYNLSKKKYEVLSVDMPSEIDKLTEFKPDIAFLVLHGKSGEDGAIQGYLETRGIKYTGSGVMASAVGMDKMIFRKVMESEGILMAPLTTETPCVVKPVDGGSSVGVSIVKQQNKLTKAIVEAKEYSKEAIVEKYIEGLELSCGVLGNDLPVVLPIIEIHPKNPFFDYEAKYVDGMADEICPARISPALQRKVEAITLKVYKAVKANGFARVDMIVREGKIFVLEINTLPGMTKNSLLPKEARAAGISYSKLLDKIIELGLE
ncbi:D-alanine--D-alanine ligase [Candidatus Shapirobacteria bacterium]|nr:D-alanine--D-alanine ligase [Candidatus Shapirobacteria bacterium]